MTRLRLLLGTENPAKVAHLRAILRGLPVEIVLPSTVPEAPHLSEGTASPRENAEAKAIAWAQAAGFPTLATDGGIDVPALADRWNPALTRRAAGPGAGDADRAAHLLKLAAGLRGVERQAVRFEVIALADRDGTVLGTWEARGEPSPIASTYDPRGVPAGFWLPGVLLFPPGSRRYGDLSAVERAAFDNHWGKLREPVRAAVRRLIPGA